MAHVGRQDRRDQLVNREILALLALEAQWVQPERQANRDL